MTRDFEAEPLTWASLFQRAVVSPRHNDSWHFVSVRDGETWRRIARFDDGAPAALFATLLIAAGFEARTVVGGPKR